MRKVLQVLPSNAQNAFVVYDVFSDRFGQKNELDIDVNKDEAVFVTTSEVIDSVLGGLVARKRNVPY